MDNQRTITGIRLQNYKAFRDTGWIDFNKFTLLYGYNSNGKSTILRFLYQLKLCIKSYRIGQNVLLWSDDNDSPEGGFLELLHNDQQKKISEMYFSFKISLSEAEDINIRRTIENIGTLNKVEENASLIYTVSYKYDRRGKKVDLRSLSIQYGKFIIYKYTTTHSGGYSVYTDFDNFSQKSDYPLPAYFNVCNTVILEDRISPRFKSNVLNSNLDEVRNAQAEISSFIHKLKMMINETLITYTDDFEYFFPSRSVPKRMMKLSLEDASRVGSYGENTYNVLYAIEVNKETDKKAAINLYLELFGYNYEWRISKNGYGEFLLMDLKTKAKINILDCGFGISQILPIIVSCFDDSKEAIAIDSPDAHLHTRVHGDICDLLINTASHRDVIVETHSENMLLRLQRRIVEKNEIYPEMATIYFITDTDTETVCKKITFNEYGDLVNEPDEFKQFFSSSFEDVMSIAKAKGERMMEKNASRN